MVGALLDQYLMEKDMTRDRFGGVDEKYLLSLEKLFSVTVNVFQFTEDDDSVALV